MSLLSRTAGFLLLASALVAGPALAGGPEVVASPEVPALGPYSQVVRANGFLFLSGQIAVDPATGKLTPADIRVQTVQVFDNIKKVLKAAGRSLKDVVKVTVFLHDPADFAAMNEVYATYFTDYKPARTTVPGVTWAPGILIEIDVVALSGD
jgi:2-iminobutanoate/2-iminopropanoate deaminase